MLTGKFVSLRPPLPGDEKFLYQVRNDFTVQKLLLALPRANSMQRVRDWFLRVMDDSQSVFFVAAVNEEAVGFIQIRKMDFVHGTGELGIYVHETAQGKGVAAEMMSLVENYVRDTFRLRKIVLQVLESNHRAISFYEKNNYSKVGIFAKHFYSQLKYHDVLIMEKFLDV
jgi:UDP-4-amino-4,6-dideoxy-N-acetyl-beta-L-altrosamine N-acetyltransferase